MAVPPARPTPLPPETLVGGRFRVGAALGQGAVGITYQAFDTLRGLPVALRELAPYGATRDGLRLALTLEPEATRRLRHRWVAEARAAERLATRHLPQARGWALDHGTAYTAWEWRTELHPLPFGRAIEPESFERILAAVLEALDALHRRGLTHGDLRPSNVQDSPSGIEVIDPNPSRALLVDLLGGLDPSPWAPPEASPGTGVGVGPSGDLYAWAAMAMHLRSGHPPGPAPERDRSWLVGLDRGLAEVLLACLSPSPASRPGSVDEVRDRWHASRSHGPSDPLRELDEQRLRLLKFRWNPRECPGCGEILLSVKKSAKAMTCPVCRVGTVAELKFSTRACPVCRVSVLHQHLNGVPPRYCPSCRVGVLARRKGVHECGACGWRSAKNPAPGDWPPSPRPEWTMECDGCGAQLDPHPEGWTQVHPAPEPDAHRALPPEEWARLAADQDPGGGTHRCGHCEASLVRYRDGFELVGAAEDPFEVLLAHQGRLLPLGRQAWLAAGKWHPAPGLACPRCRSEFEVAGAAGEHLLVTTGAAKLAEHLGQAHTLRDWHRIAAGLPCYGEEAALMRDLERTLRDAYRRGAVAFDVREPDLLWRGRVQHQGRARAFEAREDGFALRRTLRWRRCGWGAVIGLVASGDRLQVHERDGDTWELVVEPTTLRIDLESGRAQVLLQAEDLAQRMRLAIAGSLPAVPPALAAR